MDRHILLLHGPNLNLLGLREPGVYGSMGLEEINQRLIAAGAELGVILTAKQSNHEGQLIDWIHAARETSHGIIFNPGGFTHTSVALRDAVTAIAPIPVVEVHLSNVHAREDFRRVSLLAPVCRGSICGFGWRSYLLALYALMDD